MNPLPSCNPAVFYITRPWFNVSNVLMYFIQYLLVLVITLLTACSGGESAGVTGVRITQQFEEMPGADCASGGVLVITGIDTNSDGILYDDNQQEFDTHHYECNTSHWSAPQKLNTVGQSADLTAFRVLLNGDRQVFYQVSDGLSVVNRLDYYTFSTGLTRSQVLPPGKVVMNMSGHAMAVRDETVNDYSIFWASRYDGLNSWLPEVKIAQSQIAYVFAYVATHSDLLMLDEEGTTLAVARYEGDKGATIHANIRLGWSDWSLPELLDTEATYNDFSSRPKMARDGNGNAFVLWSREGRIFTKRYHYRTGWENTLAIDNGLGMIYNSYHNNIAVSHSGKAFVYWIQTVNSIEEFWGAIYSPMTGWGSAFKVETTPNISVYYDETKIAFDKDDNLLIPWLESEGNTRRIWLAKLPDQNTITHTLIYEYELDGWHNDYIGAPGIITDLYGNAMLYWYATPVYQTPVQNTVVASYWTRYFNATTGLWSSLEVITPPGNGDYFFRMYGNGKVIVAWESSDSNFNQSIWTSQLDINGL